MDTQKFIESLIAYGFREWPKSRYERHDRHWQYKLIDQRGIKLFVNIRFWEFSKYKNLDNYAIDCFDAYCQYNLREQQCFDVNLHSVDKMTPFEIVKWFSDTFDELNCTYYERFECNENKL